MELRHLKLVNEVSKSGSLTKASENLYLSQSALSHQLKEIEFFFKAQLFIRHNKQMVLTKEGRIVLLASQRILEEIESTAKSIRQMTEKDSGEIRISTECYTSYPWLSNFLKEYHPLYPKVDIKINSDATNYALSNLLENNIDIGIFNDNNNRKITYTPLFSDELYIIVNPSHRWASQTWMHVNDITDEPYIMYTIPIKESSMYKMLFPRKAPVKLYKMMITEAIIEMVKGGLGFTVLPNWVVNSYIKAKELKAIRISKKGIKRTWYAGVLKNRIVPPYMTSFINKLAKHMKYSDQIITGSLSHNGS
jgi:LysR family transcriptional regulator for metE and metH